MATAIDDLTDEDIQNVDTERDGADNDDTTTGEGAPGDDDSDDAEAEEADVITFGGADTRGEEEPEGIRNLRSRLREIERENKTLKAGQSPQVEDIGPEPNMDDFWDDEPGYKAALREYDAKVAKRDEGVAKQRELTDAVERELADAVTAFDTQRAGLKVPNFDGAAERVVERLGESGANILRIVAGEKSAALTYALGNSADRLDALGKFNLAKLTDVVKLAAEIGRMAAETNVQRRKPTTQPESVHRGQSGGSGGKDTKLERLEREAAQTNDRTKLIAYRRQLRNGGK